MVLIPSKDKGLMIELLFLFYCYVMLYRSVTLLNWLILWASENTIGAKGKTQ